MSFSPRSYKNVMVKKIDHTLNPYNSKVTLKRQ